MANYRVRRCLTLEEMNRGVGMLEVGASQRHVARQLGVSQSVVARMWSRYQMHGDVIPRYRGGRQRATTQAQDRFIVVQADVIAL